MDGHAEKLVHQMQQIEYQILCDIDQYCKENHIMYFLSGGTCLGAVRHHGFIPWDEDVDIMLPRDDYEKLILNFEKSYVGKYKVGSLETDEKWNRTFARIWDVNTELVYTKLTDAAIGIYVDIFSIDGVPDKKIRQRIFFNLINIRKTLRNASIRNDFLSYEKHHLIKRVLGVFVKPIGPRVFADRINNMGKKYPFDQSTYVGASMAAHYGIKEVIEKKYMVEAIRVPFETKEFPVPIGYDRYLTNLYGEHYMEIPKEEDRVYPHLEGWSVKISTNDN